MPELRTTIPYLPKWSDHHTDLGAIAEKFRMQGAMTAEDNPDYGAMDYQVTLSEIGDSMAQGVGDTEAFKALEARVTANEEQIGAILPILETI